MDTTSGEVQKEIDIDLPLIVLVLLFVALTFFPLYKRHGDNLKLKVQRFLNRKAHVVIVSTYGPSVDGSPFYEAYVKKAVRYITDPANKVDEVVIVGGYTVDPNRSQSRAVLDYMNEHYPEFVQARVPVTLDECGITTWQNIQNAKKLMDKEMISAKKITLFAESSREKKVSYFANALFHWDKESLAVNREIALKDLDHLVNATKQVQLNGYRAFTMNDFGKAPLATTNASVEVVSVPSGLPQEFIDEEYAKIFEELKQFYDATYASKKIRSQLEDWTKVAGFDTKENLIQKGCEEYKQLL